MEASLNSYRIVNLRFSNNHFKSIKYYLTKTFHRPPPKKEMRPT